MTPGSLAHRSVKRSLLELRNRASPGDGRQEAPILRAARIIGILLRQVGEVRRRFQLLLDVVRFRARCIDSFLVDLSVRVRRRRLDQDVSNRHRLRNAVVVLMLACNTAAIRQGLPGCCASSCVSIRMYSALILRDRIHVLLFVLVEEGLQFGVGRLDLFLDVVQRKYGILELYFCILLFKLLVMSLSLTVTPSANGGQQLSLSNFGFHFLLELLHAHAELALNEILVPVLSDEVAAGKQNLPELPLVEIVTEFVITDAEPHPVCLVDHRLLGNHVLRRPLHQVRHQGIGNVALELLLSDKTGLLRHF